MTLEPWREEAAAVEEGLSHDQIPVSERERTGLEVAELASWVILSLVVDTASEEVPGRGTTVCVPD